MSDATHEARLRRLEKLVDWLVDRYNPVLHEEIPILPQQIKRMKVNSVGGPCAYCLHRGPGPGHDCIVKYAPPEDRDG